MLKSSGTPTSTIVHIVRFLSRRTMSGLLCSILFGVCKGLSHQISLVGVLMTGSGQSILGCWSSLITSFSVIFATGLCLAVVYRLEDGSGQLPTTWKTSSFCFFAKSTLCGKLLVFHSFLFIITRVPISCSWKAVA